VKHIEKKNLNEFWWITAQKACLIHPTQIRGDGSARNDVAVGATGYALRQWQKSRNRLSSTSLNAVKRLEDINYDGEIDHDFICPILLTIMDDPVIANDGKTYDRSGVEKWYTEGMGKGLFNPKIQIDWYAIKPNYVLREQIENFVSDLEKQHEQQHNVAYRK
jgi:hypothetical protein